jgi:RNA polymerase sigma-70 factor, ECF subfamily
MLEDEHNLVARAKEGEAEAFGLLYDFYMPRIYRFVLFKAGHREEAEDLTHQVFLKAWENIEKYESRGYPFSSWLYRIARNAVIDAYRKSNPQISIEDLSPNLLTEKETQILKAEMSIEWEQLLSSMSKLKEIERDVLIMRFVDDLTHQEVAKAIGKSEGATKVIQHRALKNLKSILES